MTKDSNGISPTLDQLKSLWQKNPDLRLGQLICNVIQDPCLYYIEDKDLIKTLQVYYSHLGSSKKNNFLADNRNNRKT